MLISTQLSHIHRYAGKKAEFKIKIIENKGRHFNAPMIFSKRFCLSFRLASKVVFFFGKVMTLTWLFGFFHFFEFLSFFEVPKDYLIDIFTVLTHFWAFGGSLFEYKVKSQSHDLDLTL